MGFESFFKKKAEKPKELSCADEVAKLAREIDEDFGEGSMNEVLARLSQEKTPDGAFLPAASEFYKRLERLQKERGLRQEDINVALIAEHAKRFGANENGTQ